MQKELIERFRKLAQECKNSGEGQAAVVLYVLSAAIEGHFDGTLAMICSTFMANTIREINDSSQGFTLPKEED